MALLDFQSIRMASPVIDFERILLTNVAHKNSTTAMRNFVSRALSHCIKFLKKAHAGAV
jgi:hypothetical protein